MSEAETLIKWGHQDKLTEDFVDRWLSWLEVEGTTPLDIPALYTPIMGNLEVDPSRPK